MTEVTKETNKVRKITLQYWIVYRPKVENTYKKTIAKNN